eukprot:4996207-Amphidinium_carterae.1
MTLSVPPGAASGAQSHFRERGDVLAFSLVHTGKTRLRCVDITKGHTSICWTQTPLSRARHALVAETIRFSSGGAVCRTVPT